MIKIEVTIDYDDACPYTASYYTFGDEWQLQWTKQFETWDQIQKYASEHP